MAGLAPAIHVFRVTRLQAVDARTSPGMTFDQDDDMAITTAIDQAVVRAARPNALARLFDNKMFLIVVCLTPAIGLLMVFLSYPLGLGIWLALLLNQHVPFKSFIRAIVLLPWIVPTVLSALAFWWIYDPQFSIISHLLVDTLGWRDSNVDFLGNPWSARFSLIAANIWRGIPFVAISLLAGLQTISPSLYEAAMLDGATPWQRFRYITLPMMMPILAIVMTFSIIFTFSDFQLVYAITRGGPVNSTHLLATLAFQRGISSGELAEGAAIAVSMIPFLVFATLFSYFGLGRRKWQQGSDNVD
jgi:multiple sugar transport system permease protein